MSNASSPHPRPIITIAGENVSLGPMRRDLIPRYYAWISNLETSAFLSEAGAVISLDEEMSWFDSTVRDQSQRNFTIYTNGDFAPVGVVNLHMINWRHRKANFGIMIGEPGLRGKGLGTEATELVLEVAFRAMGLHSVWLTTFEFNIAGQRAYAKAGFQEVGRRRNCRWHDGRYWDEIHMDILEHEFTKRRLNLPGS